MEIEESLWNGFKRIDFEFEGREALLVFPNDTNKTDKWMLKTEYLDAFPALEIEMINNGWHLAYIKNKTRWCLDEDLHLKKRFADFIIKEFNLYKKCIPVGMSCGGLIATKFAALYPDYVSALYLDAPVLNLLSCPAGLGIGGGSMFEEFQNATGLSISDLICYREHPIDKMHILLENDIPVILVYGTADTVVPYKENGALLEKFYTENGGELIAISKEGCEHHPHGLEDVSPIAEFMQRYAD